LLGPERIAIREEPLSPPGAGEVILRVDAALTCGTDLKVYLRGGHPRMLHPPCPFGHEVAGTIVALGPGTAPWTEGDAVVAANSAPCGECPACTAGRENLCRHLAYLNGAFGDHLRIPSRFVERSLRRLPAATAPEVGAFAEPLACVLHALDACPDAAEALVLGAGPLGLLFVQLLSRRGGRVVLADPHPKRLDLGTRLGASATRRVARQGGSAADLRALAADPCGFELAVDATGVTAAWRDAVEAVRPGATVVFFGGCAPGERLPLDTDRIHYGELTLRGSYHYRPADHARALELLAAGEVESAPLLSAERPLDDLEGALRSMLRREALKVVIRP
jgi:L-iditol 2-dehydrogenase